MDGAVASSTIHMCARRTILGLLLLPLGCEQDGVATALAKSAQDDDSNDPPGPIDSPGSTLAGQPHVEKSSQREQLVIQPLGKQLPEADVQLVQRALTAFFDFEIVIAPQLELPKKAFYEKRQRYRAEKLLTFLKQVRPKGASRVLGLTGADISTTKGEHEDWGVLGLATVGGETCVISSFRARRRAKDAQHTRVRLAKTAVHEIGHTLGLPHCPNHGCLMEDGKGTVLTTDHEYDFCHECRMKLLRQGRPIADASRPIPWPDPQATE